MSRPDVRPRRVAAIDCGTNSLRLLIGDVTPDGTLTEVTRQGRIVRLGQGVDATGTIAVDAMQRAFVVTEDYARICREAGVEAIRFVATSASRDARNAADFVAGVQARIGVAPEVIGGAEEAELSFLGASAGLAMRGRVCVVDVGGGSTELVVGEAGSGDAEAVEGVRAVSLDIGSVRLTERRLHSDPPTEAEIASATAEIDAALEAAEARVGLDEVTALVGVAGSVTTITAHALNLPSYDSDRVHGHVLTVPQMLAACADLLHLPRADRAALGFMPAGRADVIGGGALVWSRVVGRVAARAGIESVVTSEHDILDGVVRRLSASIRAAGTP